VANEARFGCGRTQRIVTRAQNPHVLSPLSVPVRGRVVAAKLAAIATAGVVTATAMMTTALVATLPHVWAEGAGIHLVNAEVGRAALGTLLAGALFGIAGIGPSGSDRRVRAITNAPERHEHVLPRRGEPSSRPSAAWASGCREPRSCTTWLIAPTVVRPPSESRDRRRLPVLTRP
jgi:hypothetical protein